MLIEGTDEPLRDAFNARGSRATGRTTIVVSSPVIEREDGSTQ